MSLTGPQRRQLFQALLTAFPTQGELERVLGLHLNVRLATIAGGNNLNDIVFKVIEWAESRNRVTELVQAALAENEDLPILRTVATDLGVPVTPSVAESSLQATPVATTP